MHDPIVQAFWQCPTAREFQTTVTSKSSGEPHVVRWDRHSHHNPSVQYDWSCDCKGYQVRKTCSHIKRVVAENRRCGWMQFIEGGDAAVGTDRVPRCPQCGLKAEAENWAV